jgi:DNA-binding response OmpR family regulator
MNTKSVLLIDDDEISLLILQNALEMEGYEVNMTTDSLLATELFNQCQPDIVILDIYMPEKDGFELLKDIRSLSAEVFIIAISANDQYLRAIKALGANVTLSKVNMPDAIIDCINGMRFLPGS